MAIYHFSVHVISRRTGRSAVKAAAWRADERLRDELTGELADFTKRRDVWFRYFETPPCQNHASVISTTCAAGCCVIGKSMSSVTMPASMTVSPCSAICVGGHRLALHYLPPTRQRQI